jgi:hypothetical protein
MLDRQQIKVTLVETEIEMPGPMLVVQQVDRHTAESIAEQMSQLGLSTKVIRMAAH